MLLRLQRYCLESGCCCLFFFFFPSVPFHFLIQLKGKNSEMKTKTVLIIFLGCLNPKEGNPGVLDLIISSLSEQLHFYTASCPHSNSHSSRQLFTDRMKYEWFSRLLLFPFYFIIKGPESSNL